MQRLFAVLNGDGEEARVVGGAVRNAVLGETVHEIDFATTAVPDEIIRRAKAAQLRCIPTGIDHGTVTVLVEGAAFEVTTLREDVETDGRRARVRFGRSFEHDAMRRDFTINALSVTADRRIFDYTRGLHDIAIRRVRFIGEARQRIREDYLRILRFFRFHAAYGGDEMDAAAFHAVIAERSGLSLLSRERIRAELMKLVSARRAAPVLDDMSGTGILQPIIGGIAHASRLARIAEIEAAAGLEPDAELRWIAAFTLVPEDAERLRECLRMSNAETERAIQATNAAVALQGSTAPPDPHRLREFLFRHGRRGASTACASPMRTRGRAPMIPAGTLHMPSCATRRSRVSPSAART